MSNNTVSSKDSLKLRIIKRKMDRALHRLSILNPSIILKDGKITNPETVTRNDLIHFFKYVEEVKKGGSLCHDLKTCGDPNIEVLYKPQKFLSYHGLDRYFVIAKQDTIFIIGSLTDPNNNIYSATRNIEGLRNKKNKNKSTNNRVSDANKKVNFEESYKNISSEESDKNNNSEESYKKNSDQENSEENHS